MIEIYDFAGEKFLKWFCNKEPTGKPIYTAISSIVTFGVYECLGNEYLGFRDKHCDIKYLTTYRFTDFVSYLERA